MTLILFVIEEDSMQIPSALQNNFIVQNKMELSQNTTTNSTDTTQEETSTINKNAYGYFDLGEDISAYTTNNPLQQQTNKELIGYLKSIMNDTTIEGKKNLESFDISQYSDVSVYLEKGSKLEALPQITLTDYQLEHPYAVLGKDGEVIENMSLKDLYDFLGKDAFGKNKTMSEYKAAADRIGIFHVNFDERQKQFRYELMGTPVKTLEQGVKDGDPALKVFYFDGLRNITKEESHAIDLEKFKNLYSFSDEFAKTKKFQELYTINEEKNREQIMKFLQQGKNPSDIHTIGAEAFITAQVVSKNLSKSEIIEHYSNISQELKNLTQDKDKNFGENYLNKMNATITLYDTITNDLKKMWNYGDLDIKS